MANTVLTTASSSLSTINPSMYNIKSQPPMSSILTGTINTPAEHPLYSLYNSNPSYVPYSAMPTHQTTSSMGLNHATYDMPIFKSAGANPSLSHVPMINSTPHVPQGLSSYAGKTDSEGVLKVMSRHLLQQDLLKKSLHPFNDDPIYFWPWLGKIQNYIEQLELSPLNILEFLESHTTGRSRQYISNTLASLNIPMASDVQLAWRELIKRYGSSSKIATKLRSKIEAFPVIQSRSTNLGEQLFNLYDLCRVIQFNMNKCPELVDHNQANGLESLRAKLPPLIQNQWNKYCQAWEDAHYGSHPPFSAFVDWLDRQTTLRSNDHFQVISTSTRSSPAQSITASRDPNTKNETFLKTEIGDRYRNDCEIHGKNVNHTIKNCYEFQKKSFKDKQQFLREKYMCYRCLEEHNPAKCPNIGLIKCDKCKLTNHVTAMRISRRTEGNKDTNSDQADPYVKSSEIEANSTSLNEDSNDEYNDTAVVPVSSQDPRGTVTASSHEEC